MQRENCRLAAIVAADIAGFSRLVDADEEATLGALRGHRRELIDPLVADHGGRIANTAGDSLLLEFPSVVDAVRCALAIQQGMAARNSGVDAARHRRWGRMKSAVGMSASLRYRCRTPTLFGSTWPNRLARNRTRFS